MHSAQILLEMNSEIAIRFPGWLNSSLKTADAFVWRALFGGVDYMQLHPPIGMRCRIVTKLPSVMLLRASCHDQPIFIVGAPRSGTTLLFSILQQANGLKSFGQESHWVWECFHRPRADENPHELTAEQLSGFTARFIRGCYAAAFGRSRFVDKNPINSLRIHAIRHLFPNAHIVCITRNGFDVTSSLIDCWQDRNWFHGFPVARKLDIEGYGKQNWVMMLQPGWEQVANCPIEVVCSHQWLSVNEYMLTNKAAVPASQWHDIRYEQLVRSPISTIENLCHSLDLQFCTDIRQFAGNLSSNVVNTTSQPGVGKWKSRHGERIMRVAPTLQSMMQRLGYSESFMDSGSPIHG